MPRNLNSDVWIINGIPGSGKSTTARALAESFDRGAHIEGDAVQDLIVSGSVCPGQQPHDEEVRQIDLCVKNQCLLAKSFCEAGFTPVIDYVVINRSRIEQYARQLEGCDLFIVTLNPGIDVALNRDDLRPEKTVAPMWIHLEQEMNVGLRDVGVWINNSQLTVEETVQQIIKNKHLAAASTP